MICDTMKCEYCDREVQVNKYCRGCGWKAEPPEWERAEPFEYEGYIVWPLRHWLGDMIEFCFYRGRHLEGKHMVSREVIMCRPEYNEGADVFPEIFDEWRLSVAANDSPE